jgi:hypothetical protein
LRWCWCASWYALPGRIDRNLRTEERITAANPDAFFTISHFDGYSAVLIQLPKVSARALRDAGTDGWLACAPPALVRRFER